MNCDNVDKALAFLPIGNLITDDVKRTLRTMFADVNVEAFLMAPANDLAKALSRPDADDIIIEAQNYLRSNDQNVTPTEVSTSNETLSPDTVDYEALVRRHVGNTMIAINGRGRVRESGYAKLLNVRGGKHTISGFVVIEGGKVAGAENTVTIYMPPGRTIENTTPTNKVKVINVPWLELAKRLDIA